MSPKRKVGKGKVRKIVKVLAPVKEPIIIIPEEFEIEEPIVLIPSCLDEDEIMEDHTWWDKVWKWIID